VLLAYVDESFKRAFYGFGAVIADEYQTKELSRRVDEIVLTAAREHGGPINRRTEVHAHPVFHGKGDWVDLPPRVRVGIFDQVVAAVRETDVRVVLRGVDPERLRTRQAYARYREDHPPEQVAFQHLLQRIDALALRRNTHALVIADERDDRDRHRELFASYQLDGTPGAYRRTRLDRLLDTVHFAPSHHSRMLQAADVVAFLWVRSRTVEESNPRQGRAVERMITALLEVTEDHGEWP
jgi:hypothetical protein